MGLAILLLYKKILKVPFKYDSNMTLKEAFLGCVKKTIVHRLGPLWPTEDELSLHFIFTFPWTTYLKTLNVFFLLSILLSNTSNRLEVDGGNTYYIIPKPHKETFFFFRKKGCISLKIVRH